MQNEIVVTETAEVVQAREMGQTTIARATELAKSIVDMKTLAVAADFLLEIKRRRKQWADWNKPAKQKLDALKRELLERERQIDEPLERAENQILKPAIARFDAEQERKRREEENRLREEQRKKAEAEQLAKAQAAEERGDTEAVDQILEEPTPVVPVIVPKAEAPAGISYREVWKFRVTDEKLVPREYLAVDEKKIGGVVRALKNETRIPGVEVYSEKTVAGRA